MSKSAVPEKVHSSLGASSAARWMACPGSINLSRGIPDTGSAAAREGTAAHALAELALTKKQDPILWLGMKLGDAGDEVEVDENMVDFVRTYVEHCHSIAAKAKHVWIEQRFNLSALNPPAPMFGTADHVAYIADLQRLVVSDLKYGQGVVVEAKGNKQLRYYGLGAVLSPEVAGLPIKDVQLFIVQPRAAHAEGVIRSDLVPYDELVGFANDLMDAARATLSPTAPLVAGSHCKFCKASGACPAQLARAEEAAMVEFSKVPFAAMPPAPETLTDEQIVRTLSVLPIIEDWASSVRAFAKGKLERGEAMPGFKLVPTRPTRKWTDEATALQALEAMGFQKEDLMVTALKSPAQVEKVVGKKNLPAEYVSAVSSGTKMVPDSDPAQAITFGSEFSALPAGSAQ